MNWRHILSRTALHTVLMLGAAFMILPFIWMLSTSFKPPTEVLSWPPNLIPKNPIVSNYTGLFGEAPFLRYLLNSILISSVSTLVILATSIVGGYVFAKFRFQHVSGHYCSLPDHELWHISDATAHHVYH